MGPWGPKGVLAGPGTPRDPKSHVFGANRFAIRPFCVFLRPVDTQFRSGARQIGPTPSTSIFFRQFGDPPVLKMQKSEHVFERTGSSPGGLGNSAPWGLFGCFFSGECPPGGSWVAPGGLSGPLFRENAPLGAPGLPRGAMGVLAGPRTPRDPKSHLFVTNWDAMAPFCTSEAGLDIRISARISPDRSHPLNLDFFGLIF